MDENQEEENRRCDWCNRKLPLRSFKGPNIMCITCANTFQVIHVKDEANEIANEK